MKSISGLRLITSAAMSSSKVAPPRMMGRAGYRRLMALASASEATICWNTTVNPTRPYADQSTACTAQSMNAGAASSRTATMSSSVQPASRHSSSKLVR